MKSRQHFFWVQSLSALLTSTVVVQSGQTQSITPAVTSWQINRNDAKGSSTDASIHAVVNSYDADVQRIRHNDTDVYVNSTGIPSYDVGPWSDENPAVATDRNWLFRIPKSPQEEVDTKTTTSLGNIGVFVNGVPIFNSKDGFSFNNQGVWNQNAIINEADGMDAALGHPAPVMRGIMIQGFVQGQYHHHQRPVSLMAQLGDDGSSHSPIIGFAFDGFPVYGPYGFANTDGSGDVTRMESSYQLKSGFRLGPGGQYDGTYIEDYEFVSELGQLDEYNGRLAVTPEYPDGIYHYHTTIDSAGESAYPYSVGPQYYGMVVEDNFGTGLNEVNIPSDIVDYISVAYAWVGDGQWNDSSHWTPAGVPASDWVATVDNDFSPTGVTALVDSNSIVDNIHLLGTTGPMVLEVSTDVTLTATNGIIVGSGSTLKGSGTIVANVFNNEGTLTAGMPEPSTGVLFFLGTLGLLNFANRRQSRPGPILHLRPSRRLI